MGLLSEAMDNAPSPSCPRCGGVEHRLRTVHQVRDLGNPQRVVGKVYTFTCQSCRLSFTEEVKAEPPKPEGP